MVLPSNIPDFEPGELTHITGPVWLLAAEYNGRFPRCHCVYIDDGGGALVDTGAGLPVISEFIKRHPVELVINTHTHLDHVFGNHLLAGREILTPAATRDSAGDLVKLSLRLVNRELAPTWRETMYKFFPWRDYQATGTYEPGEVIRVGSTRMKALAAPGHLADHHMFHLPELGVLISGDLDLTPFGPWYGNPESDLGQFRDSLELVKELDPAVVISSHREPVSQGLDQELERYGSVLVKREQRILECLAKERTWDQVLDQHLIYSGKLLLPVELVRFFEDRMLAMHRDDLAERGLVRATSRGWILA